MAKFKMAMVASLVAVAAIGCGVTPDETVTADTASYDAPTTPTTPAGPTVDVVRENCESWGMTYDEATNTCLDDGGIGTESGTDKPTTACEDYGLVEENGTCVEPEGPVDPVDPVDPNDGIGTESGTDKPTTTCEDYGLVEENGTCVEPETETDPIMPVVPVDYEDLNFTVTPGFLRIEVSFTEIEGATSYTIERVAEGSSTVNYVPVNGTTYSFLAFCSTVYSYKLVANMADGTTVETPATDYVAPSNCQ